MRIQHNIMAMNSYRNLSGNNTALSKNLEKLSSGYRINRAGDDAAGLAISEKMRSQIAGLDQAQKNAQSGINMVKTAEGALTEVHDMLNRMVTLATQSANGTYTETDRNKLQAEVNALIDEIDRIADNSNFNGAKLLNGELHEGFVLDSKTETTPGTEDAIGSVATAIQNGINATGSTTAKVTDYEVKAGDTALQGLTLATFKAATLTSAGGAKIEDLFTVTGDGNGASSKYQAGDKITMEAKTAGALDQAILNELKTTYGIELTNGSNTGAGAAATKAQYNLTFDLTKISGGDTFTLAGKTFQFVTDGNTTLDTGVTAIDITGLAVGDTTATTGKGQRGIAEAIWDQLKAEFDTGATDYTLSAKPTTAGTSYTITMTADVAGLGGNNGENRVVSTSNGVTGTYDAGTAQLDGQKGQFAQISYKAELNKLAVGDKITIGDTEIEIVANDKADSVNKIGIDDAKNGATLAAAFEAAGYEAGKLSFANNTLTITSTSTGVTAAQFAADAGANGGKLVFDPLTDAQASQTTTSVLKRGQAMTLQIGSSSEEQIKVDVESMKATALGIQTVAADGEKTNLSIGNVEDAIAAIDKINDAIEMVSTQRGNLGAIQNRLEHTINNLGVMEENIQDAESVIRDTDVAEEMMAYTKNNILIQSAQAMLAQANQVPQGVLQLMG